MYKCPLFLSVPLPDEEPADDADHADPGDAAGDGDQRQHQPRRHHAEADPLHRGAQPVVVRAEAVLQPGVVVVLAARKLEVEDSQDNTKFTHHLVVFTYSVFLSRKLQTTNIFHPLIGVENIIFTTLMRAGLCVLGKY